MVKYIKHNNDSELIRIIRGLYDLDYNSAHTFVIEHFGECLSDKIIYNISFGEEESCDIGFAAMIYHLLYYLKIAEMIGAVPMVKWGQLTLYHDHQMDSITNNVYEYYFEPISDVIEYPINKCKNVIRSRGRHIYLFHNMNEQVYLLDDKDILLLAEQYKRYIRLNDKTTKYIQEGLALLSDKTLGVHVRGTDFALGLKRHPRMITVDEYLTKTKEMFASGKYDKVFLATEDDNALETFKNEFGECLVYYSDVFRTVGDKGPHSTPNSRPFHHYKLGLEVLRDIYTLANCESLIAGLSNVSYAVRYINIALDRKFSEIAILYKGINV